MGFLVGILLLVISVAIMISTRHSQSKEGRAGRSRQSPSPRLKGQIQAEIATPGFWEVAEPSRLPRSNSSRSSSSRIPGDRFWVPAGQEVRVRGFTIPDGMLYVGKDLGAWFGWLETEPALINPELRVNTASPNRPGTGMAYWPSYGRISPESRCAYLEWLAGGRRDPEAYIGYVFLFFYGIERRVLAEAQISKQARSEVEVLVAEVERLLGLYGSNASFHRYASEFLTVARLVNGLLKVEDLEPVQQFVGHQVHGWDWEMPLHVRLALGGFAGKGEPIPAPWALSWFLSSGQARLRTPARRCKEEFQELFLTLYARDFPEGGMTVRASETPLTAHYEAASSSLGGLTLSIPGSREIAASTSPLRKLQEIADEAMNGLDAFSRWIGRTDDRDSPAALALLPPEIAWNHESPAAQELVGWLSGVLGKERLALVHTEELVRRWPTRRKGVLSKREAEQLTGFFCRFGLGLEPDVRWGGPPLSRYRRAVVFRLPAAALVQSPPEPGPAYEEVTLLLHLAAALSAADGEVSESEERHLLEHLEEALELPLAEKVRLEAHLTWLLAEPPGLAGVKKRVEPLGPKERHYLARFLLTVAGADGHITVEELKLLQKIYPLLGLEAEDVTSDLHALMAGEDVGADQPVTVRPGEPRTGFAIPERPEPGTVPSGPTGVVLDMAKVRAMRAQTRESQAILARVFAEDDEGAAASPPTPAPPADENGGSSVAGLSTLHTRLLRQLAGRPSWPRIEVERLCGTLDLLPDGTLEEINEAAFKECGEPLLEGEDPLELDQEILKEMLA
jgi:uncharacterized tellurite resistance protein B-like protein